jgi:hypothetical protein
MTTNAPTPDAGLPRLERPRAPKVTAPSIDAALAEAAAAAQRSAAAAAEENAARNDAFRLSTRIETLRKTRGEAERHLHELESIDLEAQKENAEAAFANLYGRSMLTAVELDNLKSTELFLVKYEMRKSRTPGLIKSLKAKIAIISKEIAALESAK